MNSEQKTNDISFDKVIEIVTNSLKKSAKETKDASTQTSNDECIVVAVDTDNTTKETTTEQNEINELLNECAKEYPVLLDTSNNTTYCFNCINNILFGSNREIDFNFCKEQFWYDCTRLLKIKNNEKLQLLCRLGCILAEKVENEIKKKNAKFSLKTNML